MWPELASSLEEEEEEEETLVYELDGVSLDRSWKMGAGGGVGVRGSLAVTSRRVCWRSEDGGSEVEVEMGSVALHSISRDGGIHAKPCIYCQLDKLPKERVVGLLEQREEGEGEEEEEEDLKEIYYIPGDEGDLQAMFDAFSKAAELCPTYDEEGFDDDYAPQYMGSEDRESLLMHLESLLVDPPCSELETAASATRPQQACTEELGEKVERRVISREPEKSNEGQFDDAADCDCDGCV